MALNLVTQSNSPTKVTAFTKKQTVAIRPSRLVFDGQTANLSRKLSISNSTNLVNEQGMTVEEDELWQDYGFDTKLHRNTRMPLDSLLVSKQKLKHLSLVLAKEPHEKTSREVEELRKMLNDIPFIQQYITSDQEHLSQHDINDLSKLLLYERIPAGEEIQLYGEKSHQMYIILKGKVALAKPTQKKQSVPLDQMNIGGTFQTQIKKQGTKRSKLNKGQTQAFQVPAKNSQVMFNGIPCRFLQTVEVTDENGNIQKVKKPHPIYEEVAEMQKVLDNLKTQTLETPAYREKLEQTIQQNNFVTASERNFQLKLEQTMTARREREANKHLQIQSQTTIQAHQNTHEQHQLAHQLHMQRIQDEDEVIEQIVFHNKPTIISKDKQRTLRSGIQSRHSQNNSVVVSTQQSKFAEEPDIHRFSLVELGATELTGQSVALELAQADPLFETDDELSDNELPVDCDDQDFPTEDIFDYLGAGQYFGQLSLSENSQGKRASVYTKTNTHLLIIEKVAFQKMLALHQKRYEAELLTFLKTIPLFKYFPNSMLKKLVCYFNPVSKIVHSYLYKENEPSTHVYVVKEGEFRCTRRVVVDKAAGRIEQNPKQVYEDPQKSMKGQSKFFIRNVANHYETVELQNIGKSQVVGDEDCALSNKYNTTVQCISQEAKLLVITREDFRRIESQSAQWAVVLKNGEEKIRKYHEKMRLFKFVRLHVDDELTKVSANPEGLKSGAKKFIAGEDLLKQHRDSVKRPSGEMVENPIIQNRKLEVDLEQLIDRRVPKQILSTKPESQFSTLKRNQNVALSTAQIEEEANTLLVDQKRHARNVSTAQPNTRRPPLQAKLTNTLHKTNAVSQVFDKYLTPNSVAKFQTGASQKVARNSRGFSTADTLQSMNTRKLQTTAYLRLRENFKTRSQGSQSQTTNKNIKYSMSWNLSPTHNQPQVRPPVELNNII